MSIKVWAAVGAMGILAACSNDNDRIQFEGYGFRAKASAVDRDTRHLFTVSIRDVSRSLEGARAAGLYYGTEYCINLYGSSDITWSVGPDTPAEELRLVDDTLVYEGACPTR